MVDHPAAEVAAAEVAAGKTASYCCEGYLKYGMINISKEGEHD